MELCLLGTTTNSSLFQRCCMTMIRYNQHMLATAVNDNGATVSVIGPKVSRTISELKKTRIHEAYFILNPSEFEEYFRDHTHSLKMQAEFSTTHPEYLQLREYKRPKESLVIEALIWHTDFRTLR